MQKPKIVYASLQVLIAFIHLNFLYAQDNIKIEEGYHEERPHFIIHTPLATYYYDKAGGGFSRMMDREGNDWISFKKEPWNEYPASAASSYRGLPNLVFRSEDGGAGHPGFDQCVSFKKGNDQIVTESKSGQWKWRWTFYKDHAVLLIDKIDPQQPYWFLYEGTPGGKYAPQHYYFGYDSKDSTLIGPTNQFPDLSKGTASFGQYRWIYTGHQQVKHVLYMLQLKADGHTDLISYMGNSNQGVDSKDGMTVFGFGRGPQTQALLTEPQSFVIGFYPQTINNKTDHQQLTDYMEKLIKRHLADK
jgi:hypothetical protein